MCGFIYLNVSMGGGRTFELLMFLLKTPKRNNWVIRLLTILLFL